MTARGDGVSNAGVVSSIVRRAPSALVVAIGDDATDEDMFAVLPESAASVRVGDGDTKAAFRVGGVDEVRALLCALVEAQGPGGRP